MRLPKRFKIPSVPPAVRATSRRTMVIVGGLLVSSTLFFLAVWVLTGNRSLSLQIAGFVFLAALVGVAIGTTIVLAENL